MSATLKSGLLFGLIGLVIVPLAVLASFFIPFIGPFLCLGSPLLALLIGGVGGFFAVRWSDGQAGVGQGVLSGTIAGVGMLVGVVLLWVIGYGLIQSNPDFQLVLQEAMDQAMAQQNQQPGSELTPDQMVTMFNTVVPLLGICLGVIYLVASLIGGAFGALIGHRGTASVPPVPPMPTVPPMS